MNIFIFLILITVNFPLLAGDKIGNGGDVIVCPGVKTILLDLYQGSEDWGFNATDRIGSRSEIIAETLNDFIKTDVFIGTKLYQRALEIEKEITQLETDSTYRSKLVKLTQNKLVNISDEGVAELPEGCEIVQVAAQVQIPLPREVKFTFQKNVWSQLDPSAQSSLILHEVIYEFLISVEETSSRSTRYFNAALHAGYFDQVKGYFEVSGFFKFKNLLIETNRRERVFGANKKCVVKREIFRPSNGQLGEGTTITINRKSIFVKESDFDDAMKYFWKYYVSVGACD